MANSIQLPSSSPHKRELRELEHSNEALVWISRHMEGGRGYDKPQDDAIFSMGQRKTLKDLRKKDNK